MSLSGKGGGEIRRHLPFPPPHMKGSYESFLLSDELTNIALESKIQGDLSNCERLEALADIAMNEAFPSRITKETIGEI